MYFVCLVSASRPLQSHPQRKAKQHPHELRRTAKLPKKRKQPQAVHIDDDDDLFGKVLNAPPTSSFDWSKVIPRPQPPQPDILEQALNISNIDSSIGGGVHVVDTQDWSTLTPTVGQDQLENPVPVMLHAMDASISLPNTASTACWDNAAPPVVPFRVELAENNIEPTPRPVQIFKNLSQSERADGKVQQQHANVIQPTQSVLSSVQQESQQTVGQAMQQSETNVSTYIDNTAASPPTSLSKTEISQQLPPIANLRQQISSQSSFNQQSSPQHYPYRQSPGELSPMHSPSQHGQSPPSSFVSQHAAISRFPAVADQTVLPLTISDVSPMYTHSGSAAPSVGQTHNFNQQQAIHIPPELTQGQTIQGTSFNHLLPSPSGVNWPTIFAGNSQAQGIASPQVFVSGSQIVINQSQMVLSCPQISANPVPILPRSSHALLSSSAPLLPALQPVAPPSGQPNFNWLQQPPGGVTHDPSTPIIDFSDSTHMKQGQDYASREQPYECEICHKWLKGNMAWNEHMGKHPTCKLCRMTVRTPDDLKQHYREMHNYSR